MKIIHGLFSTVRKALVSGVIVSLLAANILMVTSAQFFDMMSSIFEALPVKSLMAKSPNSRQKQLVAENKKLRTKNSRMRNAVNSSSSKVKKRLARSAARDAAAGGLELFPLLGGGVALADTALDAWDTCTILAEMRDLESIVNGSHGPEETPTVCGFSAADISVASTKPSPQSLGEFPLPEDYSSHTFKETVGETTAIAKDNIQTGWGRFREALGGTIAEIVDE